MSDLLLELFSEEIPARMQVRAAEQLADLLGDALKAENLGWQQATSLATTRRIVLMAHGLPVAQADREVERKGPRVGAPQAAMDGFLRSLGEIDYRLEERDEKKGAVTYALFTAKGRTTPDVLAELVPGILAKFPWPKSMRWAAIESRWVRPLQRIVCLFDDQIVPFEFAGVASGRTTFGHRFMAPEPIEIRNQHDYEASLEQAFVMLDGNRRRALIEQRAQEIAKDQNLRLRDDPGLLRELQGLAEWPVPLCGRIDDQFMELPDEVLVISMRSHQRYLALETSDGALAQQFVVVANIEASDGGAAIIAGNERVLRARLWDAKFFWDQDRKQPLEARLPQLEAMVFHAELGSLRTKVERIEHLATAIAGSIEGADPSAAARAASLAKCDLVTGMVGEFPELQGVMGGYYARAFEEPETIAKAIAEHYSPQGPSDRCPSAPTSIAVALADKIDTLAGFFGADIKPTGSSDPFALRRSALSIIRLVLENGLRLNLLSVFGKALEAYGHQDASKLQATVEELRLFMIDRLKVQQRQLGVRHDIVEAVNARPDGDLVRIIARVRALQVMIETPEGADLLAGYKRARNIVAQSSNVLGDAMTSPVDLSRLVEPSEHELGRALTERQPRIAGALKAEDYTTAVGEVAALRSPIDAFFDQVLVNVDDPETRLNRLRLLHGITQQLETLADFSLIEDRR